LLLTFLYIFLVVLVAGLLQATTGFGFALITTPLLIFVMNPIDVVIFNFIISTVILTVMVYQTFSKGDMKEIKVLLGTSIAGTILGTYVISRINDDILKIFIGVVLILVTLTMNLKIDMKLGANNLARSCAGFVSGFLGATTSLGGPPVILFMMSQKEDKDFIRANLACFFFLGNLITLSLFFLSGNLHFMHMSTYLLVAIPAVLIGYVLGNKMFSSINSASFNKISSGVVLLGAVTTLFNGVLQLLK